MLSWQRRPSNVSGRTIPGPVWSVSSENMPEALLRMHRGLTKFIYLWASPFSPIFMGVPITLTAVADKTSRGFFNLVAEIRRLKPDLAIVLPNSFRSALIARCGGVKKIYGYRRNGRNLLLSGGPSPHDEKGEVTPRPMVEYYLEICRWLQLTVAQGHQPRLHMSGPVKKSGQRLLERYGITPGDMVIGLNPGAKFAHQNAGPRRILPDCRSC